MVGLRWGFASSDNLDGSNFEQCSRDEQGLFTAVDREAMDLRKKVKVVFSRGLVEF
jgi:hypothetical protein